MRNRIRMLAVTTVVIAAVAIGSGCSSPKFPPYPGQAPSLYEVNAHREGLSVGMRAITDPKELRKYFGVNLMGAGVFPVHIVVDNESETDSYILVREKVFLLGGGKLSAGDRRGVGRTEPSATVSVVGAALASPVVAAIAAQYSNQAIGRGENFALKEFQCETVEPGCSAGGFVYFTRPDSSEDGATVRLSLLEPLSGREIQFDLNAKGN